METYKLTPQSNNTIRSSVFSGGFAQPDGFSSVLTASVHTDGHAGLTLVYRAQHGQSAGEERMWSIRLTNEQRKELVKVLDADGYEPTLFHSI
jgi:hypothetical protein